MPDSIYSLAVWHRRYPKSCWVFWQRFPSGHIAAEAIRAAKRRGKLRGETLAMMGDVDPNVVLAGRKGG